MRSLKRTLLAILMTVAGLVLLGTGIAFLYRAEVKQMVVGSINERLTTRIEVGDITFSILKHFPYATLNFSDVTIHEPAQFVITGHVMKADNISLLFSLRSIFSKQYKLKKIILSDAAINLQTDIEGNNNYEIWKQPENKNGSENEMHLELEDVVLKNVDVLYYHAIKKQDISFLVIDGNLKGDFNNERYLLNTVSELKNTSVIFENVRYLSQVDCNVQMSLQVDKTNGTYTFRNTRLQLADLSLGLEGVLTDNTDGVDLNLQISSPSADLPALLSLIPGKYTVGTKDYNYSGKVEFSGSVKGHSGKKSSPVIAFNFRSIDVSLNPKDTPYRLNKMNGTGYFTNRKSKTTPVTYLKLENFSATLEGKPILVDLEVENFNAPLIKLKASIAADLKALSRFYLPDTLESVSGDLFADINFNGIASEKSTYQSSGSVRFEKVNFRVKQKPLNFTGFSGIIHLRGNDVLVEEVSGIAGTSDFTVKGSFNNLVAFLLLENQKLEIKSTLASNRINLDELMLKDINRSQVKDTVYRLNFSEQLKFQVDATIGELKFRKFSATNIRGTIALESKILTTKDLDFNTAGGTVSLKGVIDDRPVQKLLISYDAVINKVNINSLFYEMGNFGQTVLVNRNLKGTVTAGIRFSSTWSDRLEVDENSIYAKSDITIENGELIDFEPMLALSRFLKGTDLKTIKFSTLTNTIEIKNRNIHIPLMEIKSSAIDITASGLHSFDNIVDYKLRLYLSQILGRKVKQQNTEFGTIEDDGLGRPMIFLSMKGPASDPKFEWDRKSVEKKITDEIKSESKNIKTILKEEFGGKSPQKSPDQVKQSNKKQEELQIDYDDEE